MTEGEPTRLVAWSNEMRRAHHRLRETLRVAQEAVRNGTEAPSPTADLLLYCLGFCTALTGQHDGEDRESHFRYEERQLLNVLDALELEADPHAVFGPL